MATRSLPLAGGHQRGFAKTFRSDTWWLQPAITLFVLLGFIVYASWAGNSANHYYADPYLSPMYSPLLFTKTSMPGSAPVAHAWFGEWPAWWPEGNPLLPPSPALLILVFPGLFRFTCYYYRKAYYRAFAGSPPACAVGPAAAGKPYKGETFLLLFQNLHRFALYPALAYIVILYYDAFVSFFKDGQFGVGVGSLVLLINATLLGSYTVGCHSFRHLIGGHDDCMSCDGKGSMKLTGWKRASWFNARHAYFAWFSLIWVGFTDFYVRMVSMGVFKDFNTWS